MLCNHTSRFDVAIAAVRGGASFNPKVAITAHEAESYFKHMAQKEREYIYKNGKGVLSRYWSRHVSLG
jgi:xylulose-5-phosphate/fructose-6-phosphate phosphoketolase